MFYYMPNRNRPDRPLIQFTVQPEVFDIIHAQAKEWGMSPSRAAKLILTEHLSPESAVELRAAAARGKGNFHVGS